MFTSGYRCSVDPQKNSRTTAHHHGKAMDIDVALEPGMGKRDDMVRCHEIRGLLVEESNAQVGWLASKRQSLKPADIAPTWVHYDVRSDEPEYVRDDFLARRLRQTAGWQQEQGRHQCPAIR